MLLPCKRSGNEHISFSRSWRTSETLLGSCHFLDVPWHSVTFGGIPVLSGPEDISQGIASPDRHQAIPPFAREHRLFSIAGIFLPGEVVIAINAYAVPEASSFALDGRNPSAPAPLHRGTQVIPVSLGLGILAYASTQGCCETCISQMHPRSSPMLKRSRLAPKRVSTL